MSISIGTRRAVGYRRVSTRAQAGERHSSLPEQATHIAGYCTAHDLALVATFSDVASGKRDDRADYRRLVRYALDGGAEVVIVQWLDRFGRNAREILRRVWELQEHGIEVVASDEDIKEELLLLLKAGIAAQESRRNGERVRSKLTAAAKRGTHFGRAPYGYRRVRGADDRVTFEIEPAEADAVREMVRLVTAENLGYKSLADRLAAGGYPAPNGPAWSADSVRRILGNEALVGTLVYNQRPSKANADAEVVRVPDFYQPAVLTAAEWAALQQRLTIRREHPRGPTQISTYLLSGIARCGHCGGPMVGKKGYARVDKHGNPRQYANYWCSRAQRSRALCSFYNGHSAPKLERAVLDALAAYADPTKAAARAAAMPAPASTVATELARVSARLGEIEVDFAQNLDLLKRKVIDEDDFKRANATRKDERERLTREQDRLQGQVTQTAAHAAAAATLPGRIQSFTAAVETLPTAQAKALLQGLLVAAHVARDRTVELEFRV